MTEKNVNSESNLNNSKRRFLKKVTGLLYALLTALISAPLLAFITSPAFRKKNSDWIDLGYADEFISSKPVEVKYVKIIRDGWKERNLNQSAWVYENNGEIVAISPVCTHLGCTVAFDSVNDGFACPCHGGRYNIDGEVTGGPPPRPLSRHEVKVEDGILYIGEPIEREVV